MSNPQDQAAIQPAQEAANNEPAKQEKKLEGEELKEAVRKQIEFYFSPQNLANDAYLVSHMNKDHYVGLELISSFKILKALTTDPEVIKKAILDSKVLQLDETGTKVRPLSVSAQQRTTIIIRDIEATLEELTALFPDSYKPKQIKPDIAFTWYVIYDDEASTMRAFDFLRTVTFKDEPIRARIKSENIIKSTVTNSATTARAAPPAAVGGRQGAAPYYWDPSQGFYPDPFRGAFRGGRGGSFRGGRGGRRGGKEGANAAASGATGGRRRDNSPPPQGNGGDRKNRDGSINNNNNNFAGRGGRKSRRNSDFEKRHSPNQPLPNFSNKSAFPSLPSLSKYEAQSSGYEGEFILYAKQTVIDVFNKQVNSLQKPEDLPANCTAVLSSPITSMELTKLLPTIAPAATPAIVSSAAAVQGDAAAVVVVVAAAAAATSGEQQQVAAQSSVAQGGEQQQASGEQQIQNSQAQIQIPNKSFAEVAITAKDIKTPEYKKPRNNSFSKKNKDGEEKKERPQSASNKHQQQQDKPASASQKEKPQKHERREKGEKQVRENKQQQDRPKSGGNQQRGGDKQHGGNNKKKQGGEQNHHHNNEKPHKEKKQKEQKEQQQQQQQHETKQEQAQQQESSSTSWAAVVTKKASTPKDEQAPAQQQQQAAPVAEKKD